MLKRYTLPNVKGEGWAIIVIDTEVGFFSTVSDWGNWAYRWTHPGEDFRRFLSNLEPDYLAGKLLGPRDDRKVYDDRKTRRLIFERLREMVWEAYDRGADWRHDPDYVRERDLYREHKREHGFYDNPDFDAWARETELEEVWDLRGLVWNRECWSFVTKIYPRLQKMLKDEIAAEALSPPLDEVRHG